MKKYLLIFFALVSFSISARANEAIDSMETALAAYSDSSSSQSETSETFPSAPEVASAAAPISAVAPETSSAPDASSSEPASEPIKARDVLPEAPASDDLEKIVLDEEGNEVSAKNIILEEAAKAGMLMLADFDSGDKPNNLGGDYGGWDKDPGDDTQGCRATHASDDSTGNLEGFSLRLDYDVDSPKPSYNGFWMKLENVNALPYDTLSLDVRGASHKFTKRLKVEFKTPDNRSSSFFISGITDQWQTIQIPLKRFKGIRDWSILSELILVFDDINIAPKKGTLLVDQIRLERVKGGMPQKGEVADEAENLLSEKQGSEELTDQST